MSYTGQLKMRGDVLRLADGQQDGELSIRWDIVSRNQRCFLDLSFLRAGKDPIWVPDSDTAENRSGVLFLPPRSNVEPGDRIQMNIGPTGTFLVKSSLDEAWTPTKLHHLECYVQEVKRVYTPVESSF